MIVNLGLQSRVLLPGRMTPDQLAALYTRASLFVLPCLVTDNGDRDGIPNVLIEALASGAPAISTDVAAVSERVQPQTNVLLVEPRDARAPADAQDLLHR